MKFFILYFAMAYLQMFLSSSHIFSYIDFVFIFVFLVNSQFSVFSAMVFSFFSGLYADFYYSFPLGLHSMIYVSLSYILYLMKEKIEFDFIFSRFLNFIIFSFGIEFFTYVIGYLTGCKMNFGWINLILPFFNFVFYEIIRSLTLRILKGS
ncbi:MAG: hypothetical protein ACP5IO_04920 [Elusimicrobiales bacterium]